MREAPPGEAEAAEREAGEGPLIWRSWPAAERPGQAVTVAAAITAAAFGLGLYGGQAIIGGVALAILVLSLSAYFFPTRYRIDEQGVEAAGMFGTRRRTWSELRSYSADGRGVTVSPFAATNWLESYRGVRVLYARNRDEVIRAVAARLAPTERRGAGARHERERSR